MRFAHPFVLLLVAFALASGCAGVQSKKTQEVTEQAEFKYKMGAAYFESHEIPLAIKSLTEALAQNPDHKQSHYLLAFIYQGRRDYTKSIHHYNEALRIDPKYHFARNNLGTVYLTMERWDEAATQFATLLEEPLYPTPELAHNNLGWAKYQRRRYQEALEHFKMATFLKPQLCLAHNNLGLTYQALQNNVEAFNSFGEALRLCPQQYAEPHFHIGKLLAEAGDARARSHFEACARLEPGTNLGRRCREYLAVR